MQEWVDGVKLTDKASMAAAGLDVVDFVDVGIECTLEQLLGSAGLFHADPHPGALSFVEVGRYIGQDGAWLVANQRYKGCL